MTSGNERVRVWARSRSGGRALAEVDGRPIHCHSEVAGVRWRPGRALAKLQPARRWRARQTELQRPLISNAVNLALPGNRPAGASMVTPTLWPADGVAATATMGSPPARSASF